jgi:hypothetical protein
MDLEEAIKYLIWAAFFALAVFALYGMMKKLGVI